MKNYHQRGDVIDVIAPGDVVSGAPGKFKSLVGFYQKSAKNGEVVGLAVEGVFRCPKVSGQAWDVGDPLYLNSAGTAFTKTEANGLIQCGHAAALAGSTDTEGLIVLGIHGIASAGS